VKGLRRLCSQRRQPRGRKSAEVPRARRGHTGWRKTLHLFIRTGGCWGGRSFGFGFGRRIFAGGAFFLALFAAILSASLAAVFTVLIAVLGGLAFAIPRAGIVGDIPPAALELQSRRRNQPFHRTAALIVRRKRRIGKLLDDFELFTAGVTFIFVQRHA